MASAVYLDTDEDQVGDAEQSSEDEKIDTGEGLEEFEGSFNGNFNDDLGTGIIEE